MKEGSFDPVIDGCEGVFHTAFPVLYSSNPQVDLIEPAVNGKLNVLRSCAKAASVKRVVLTSSMGSVMCNGKPLTPDVIVDETWFSNAAFCESNKLWYMLSKTLAEEAAWEFAKENGLDIIATNPGFVIGPLLQPTINFTLEGFLNTVKGAQSVLMANTTYVDVRDVANAHLQAFEITSACGRYCLVGAVAHFSEIAKILLQYYPSLRLPGKFEDDKQLGLKYEVSKEKARILGINFTPLEVSVKETIESLKEKGVLDV